MKRFFVDKVFVYRMNDGEINRLNLLFIGGGNDNRYLFFDGMDFFLRDEINELEKFVQYDITAGYSNAALIFIEEIKEDSLGDIILIKFSNEIFMRISYVYDVYQQHLTQDIQVITKEGNDFTPGINSMYERTEEKFNSFKPVIISK